MMQKLATVIAMDRMMNVANFSSFNALKRFLFISFQSRTRRASAGDFVLLSASMRATAASSWGRTPASASGSEMRTSILLMRPAISKNSCAAGIST